MIEPFPYYQDEFCTIYHGDCAEITPWLGFFDLLLTDPPYGIATGVKSGRGSKAADQKVYEWDNEIPSKKLLEELRSQARHQIIWGGNYFELPPTSCILVWDKDDPNTSFADCELAWTNFPRAVRKFVHRWSGNKQEPGLARELKVHPTQKPIRLMHWCLSFAPEAKIVLDPFMGSGTTLLACKQKGIKAVGIEREKDYCDRAVERLQQTRLNLFA